VKGITLFIFGGVAQIGQEPKSPGAEFRIAIAGPLVSLGWQVCLRPRGFWTRVFVASCTSLYLRGLT